MTTAQQAIADFLTELHERGYAIGTRRLRGHYLTEYLEHAQNADPNGPLELTAEELIDLERADARLAAAAAGELRQRNTLHGPRAASAAASERSRSITYNVFAAYVGTPWRLEIPPNETGEHLDPEEAAQIIYTLAVRRPTAANDPRESAPRRSLPWSPPPAAPSAGSPTSTSKTSASRRSPRSSFSKTAPWN
ncbi:hypothetical protein [Streptomyces werraensis]|uniref:hypothetical protein n=1 Tax=Streptomyces werraensis TaxID=68284 RepID=UPI001CE35A52